MTSGSAARRRRAKIAERAAEHPGPALNWDVDRFRRQRLTVSIDRDPVFAVLDVQAAIRALQKLEAEIAAALLADGLTYADLGSIYGMTRQAAWQRFGGRGGSAEG